MTIYEISGQFRVLCLDALNAFFPQYSWDGKQWFYCWYENGEAINTDSLYGAMLFNPGDDN